MKSISIQSEDLCAASECHNTVSFPKAVNIILTNKCNYQCKFCFGQYNFLEQWPDDSNIDRLLSILCEIGVEKVTFEGGEPFTHPDLFNLVEKAKNLGLTTSIISNGSFITKEIVERFSPMLDWFGLSIDSASESVEQQLGRGFGNHVAHIEKVAEWSHSSGIKIKINIVVNKKNYKENMSNFLISLSPSRVKVFQCLKMTGENDADLSELSITEIEFKEYVSRHVHLKNKGIDIVFEESQHMVDSYLMILPDGKLLSNHNGRYQATEGNLFNNKPEVLLEEIQWNSEAFVSRGGEYQW